MDRWNRAQTIERNYWEDWVTRTAIDPLIKMYWKFHLQILHSVLPPNPNPILEIGCGTHPLINYLQENEKHAIDPLMDLYAPHLPRSLQIIQGVGETLPFRNNAFSLVITTNTLDHCIDPVGFLDEIHRILKEMGTLYLSVNCFLSRHNFVKQDPPHPHNFIPSDIVRLLQYYGFQIISHRIGIGDLGVGIDRLISLKTKKHKNPIKNVFQIYRMLQRRRARKECEHIFVARCFK